MKKTKTVFGSSSTSCLLRVLCGVEIVNGTKHFVLFRDLKAQHIYLRKCRLSLEFQFPCFSRFRHFRCANAARARSLAAFNCAALVFNFFTSQV